MKAKYLNIIHRLLAESMTVKEIVNLFNVSPKTVYELLYELERSEFELVNRQGGVYALKMKRKNIREVVYELIEQGKGRIKQKDIAKKMGIKAPSVCVILKKDEDLKEVLSSYNAAFKKDAKQYSKIRTKKRRKNKEAYNESVKRYRKENPEIIKNIELNRTPKDEPVKASNYFYKEKYWRSLTQIAHQTGEELEHLKSIRKKIRYKQ